MTLFGSYKRPVKPQTQVTTHCLYYFKQCFYFSKLSAINLCRSTYLLGVGDKPVDMINR